MNRTEGFDTGQFAGINLEQMNEMPLTAGIFVVLTGPSNVGKTAVAGQLAESDPSIKKLITLTTRKPRLGEENGEHYHFVSEGVFMRERDMGNLVESAEYSGGLYGTPKSEMDRLLTGTSLISVMEMSGASTIEESIMESYGPRIGSEITARMIVVMLGISNPWTIIRRAVERTDANWDKIVERFRKDKELWREHGEKLGKNLVINDEGQFPLAVSMVRNLIKARKESFLPHQD